MRKNPAGFFYSCMRTVWRRGCGGRGAANCGRGGTDCWIRRRVLHGSCGRMDAIDACEADGVYCRSFDAIYAAKLAGRNSLPCRMCVHPRRLIPTRALFATRAIEYPGIRIVGRTKRATRNGIGARPQLRKIMRGGLQLRLCARQLDHRAHRQGGGR